MVFRESSATKTSINSFRDLLDASGPVNDIEQAALSIKTRQRLCKVSVSVQPFKLNTFTIILAP